MRPAQSNGNIKPPNTLLNSRIDLLDRQIRERLTLTMIAIEWFRLKNNRQPSSLNDLVPDFMSNVPIDVMDGKPLRCQPLDGRRFELRSVGLDG